MRRLLFACYLLLTPFLFQAAVMPDSLTTSIVPKPVTMKPGAGEFVINRFTVILVKGNDAEAIRIATFFADRIRYAGGPILQVREMTKDDKTLSALVFEMQLQQSSLPEEGYALTVTAKKVLLAAKSGSGLFHGVQTLFQLLPSEISRHNPSMTYKEWAIPALKITDYPAKKECMRFILTL